MIAWVPALPVTRPTPPRFHDLFKQTAEMVFIRRRDRRFAPLGQLPASPREHGRRRPPGLVRGLARQRPAIFLGGRVFALLGYVLVEGSVGKTSIREVGRLDSAPAPPRRGD